jgi:hypothetical protein
MLACTLKSLKLITVAATVLILYRNALAPRFTRHLLFEFDSSQPAPELEFRMYDIERDSQKELIGLHRATAIDFATKLRYIISYNISYACRNH